MIHELTFVTPLRIDCKERRRNWRWVYRYFHDVPAKWIVVETGSSAAVGDNVQRIEAAAFGRASSRNIGLNQVETPYVCFIDADMVMRLKQFLQAWNTFLQGEYDAYSPYDHVVYVSNDSSAKALERKDYIRWSFLNASKNGIGANITGGICFMKRESALAVGGYSEDFKKWGFEDLAMDFHFKKLGMKTGMEPATAYHLWHPAKRRKDKAESFRVYQQYKAKVNAGVYTDCDRVRFQQLEYHITDTCNLHCSQCAHYSNFVTKGMVSLEQATGEMEACAARVRPDRFYILGGEPTINPELVPILQAAKGIFKDSRVDLITNGFFLHRHPELPDVCSELNIKIRVSQHHASKEYLEKFQPVRDLLAEWKVKYPGLMYSILESQDLWEERYRFESDGKAYPFQSRASYAWQACVAKRCHTLYQRHLWKCPPLTYFQHFEAKLKLYDIAEWDLFRKYKAVPLDAPIEDIRKFVAEGPIAACSLCPQKPNRISIPNPLHLPIIDKIT